MNQTQQQRPGQSNAPAAPARPNNPRVAFVQACARTIANLDRAKRLAA